MYRRIHPRSPQELPLRMLFQPTDDGLFHHACEADGYRGLVAAILDDPAYETETLQDRLELRLRLANDLILLGELEARHLKVGDRNVEDVINVHSDREFILSLGRIGYLSLAKPPEWQ